MDEAPPPTAQVTDDAGGAIKPAEDGGAHLATFTHESDAHTDAIASIIKTTRDAEASEAVSRKRSKSIGASSKSTPASKKSKNLSKSLKLKSECNGEHNDNEDEDDDDDFDSDDDDDDFENMDEEFEGMGEEEGPLEESHAGLEGRVNDENEAHTELLNGSAGDVVKHGDNEKLRRRLPMSIKELIDYHSSNGKSIKEIVNKINVVCRPDEKVSYGVRGSVLLNLKLESS